MKEARVPGWLDKFLLAWIPLFVALSPIGLAPIFIGLTQSYPPDRVTRIGRQAVWTAAIVAIGFMFLGKFVFRALGITVSDFQVAGGLILLIIASRDLVADHGEDRLPEDLGVVPLGMPLITGPATITTLLILIDSVGLLYTLIALVTNLLLVYLVISYSDWLRRRVGMAALKATSKIMSLLLAAIAVNMIHRGWKTMQ
jgi:multiple antibiotic resistance protein